MIVLIVFWKQSSSPDHAWTLARTVTRDHGFLTFSKDLLVALMFEYYEKDLQIQGSHGVN